MTIKPDLSATVPDRLDSLHFIGIGGAGMSGIAAMFLAAGVRVSGSDRARNAATDRLSDAGAAITIGHAAANVGEVDAVVVTSALWPDNAELAEARRRGVPVLHRSQALNALIAGRRLVAVAGAHGKTTSTAMLAVALDALGADPSFVIGGVSADFGVASRAGSGDVFVVEADESDGSFLVYDTAVALILNVDADHLDHYGTEAAFEDAFVAFADAASEVAVLSADDPGARRVAARVTGTPVRTVGWSDGADVRISDVTTDGPAAGTLTAGGESVRIRLRVPGAHNVGNAAAVVAVLTHLGHGLAESAAAVERFTGTGRRFDRKGIVEGVSVYDDYAHLPAEVDAALTAARTVVGDGRILAVHQPHLYSRTAAMAGRFAEVLERTADHTVVLDVDGAREDPVPGVTGRLVTDRFRDASKVDYEPDWAGAAARVAALARPGDFVITLGCGSVYRIVPSILDELARRPVAAG